MSEAAKFWGAGARVRLQPYAHRHERPMNWLDRTLRRLQGGASVALTPRRLSGRRFVREVIARSDEIVAAPGTIPDLAAALRPRLVREGIAGAARVEAFALARAAFAAEMGFAQRPVQVYGALRLLDGCILEMATGEGKSATACLAAAVAALAGVPVHVVTVNDYLARRDADLFAPVFARLGLTSGLVTHDHDPAARAAAYRSDIVYVDNKELVFDYLKDRIAIGHARSHDRTALRRLAPEPGRHAVPRPTLLRGLHFAIIDEADSILVDEAGTPLIISAPGRAAEDPAPYAAALALAGAMRRDRDFRLEEQGRVARLRPAGRRMAEDAAADGPGGLWQVPKAREELLRQAIVAVHVMQRGTHYIVQDGKVQIVDEFTGRAMPDRTWRAGLHQLVELKEALELSERQETAASITYQRFFRQYLRASGMTGTGIEVAGEMRSFFDLRTVPVPTYRPVRRRHLGTRMVPDAGAKHARVLESVRRMQAAGRPVLIGVRSVSAAEAVSEVLTGAGLPHEVLSARHDADEAARVAQAGQAGSIMVATNMAGRGTDIPLGPGVAEAGGLHVILTEFHEARRVDRQLYGRAGRQGEPGSVEDIVAFDDDLFTRHAPRLRRLLAGVPGASRSRLAAALLRRVAQRRAEQAGASLRRAQVQAEKDRLRALAAAGHDPV